MASASCFKRRDDLGPYIKVDWVLRLKGYDFTFRPEPTDFVSEADFVPLIWSRTDSDDPSDKGLGGDPGSGQDSANAPPAREGDGDIEMTIASGSGVVGGNSLAAAVQSLLIGRAVTPINPRPRTLSGRSPSRSTPASGGERGRGGDGESLSFSDRRGWFVDAGHAGLPFFTDFWGRSLCLATRCWGVGDPSQPAHPIYLWGGGCAGG